jgi:4'-phosphopantetheinyl transferase
VVNRHNLVRDLVGNTGAVTRGGPAAIVRWLSWGLGDVPRTDEWLSTDEVTRLESLRFAKRRTELRLARWTAKQAIAHAVGLRDGFGDGDLAVLAPVGVRPATTGAPLAFVGDRPAEVSMSMTDRADWAVSVVGPSRLGLGCDLELVEPRSTGFVCDFLTDAERALVEAAPSGESRDRLANLVWSAKESALKVLQTGLRRDTRSVEVDVVGQDAADRWAPLRVRAEEGTTFYGWWRCYGECGDFLLTVVADAELDPPVAMDEPPRLARAVPSHAWMDADVRAIPRSRASTM